MWIILWFKRFDIPRLPLFADMKLAGKKKKKEKKKKETGIQGREHKYEVWFGGISTIVGYLMPNPVFTYTHIYIYIYISQIYMIWFGLVLWHINHCRLFNAKSKYKWFINTFCRYIQLNEQSFIFNNSI